MVAVKLCVRVIFLLSLCKLDAFGVQIDCVPLENCPFAINILTKGQFGKQYFDFLHSTECGVDENTNKIKVWCSKFVNCKTPDFRSGTCIPSATCAELSDYLRDARTLLGDYRCYIPGEAEEHSCCPWGSARPKSSRKKKFVAMNKRYASYYPWSMHNHFEGPGYGFPEDHSHNHGFDWGRHRHSFFGEDHNKLDNDFGDSSMDSRNGGDWGRQNHFPDRFAHNADGNSNSTEDSSSSSEEGCLTPNNSDGVCKEIRQCPSMIKALQEVNVNSSKEVDYLKRFQCSSAGNKNIRVCCSDDPIVLPKNGSVAIVPKVVDSEESSEENNTSLVPDPASCGRQIIDDKIVGGSTTGLAEFPWTALLQYTTTRGRRYGCGGSVISKRYVITAAHCVNEAILRQAGLQKLDRVILGEYDTRNDTDCFYSRSGSDCADPPQRFSIERIVEHELFRPNNTMHDIALIRIDRDITFSNYIMPICLPDKNSFRLLGNESFFITGWGRTETGEPSPVKRKARLPFIDNANCSQLGSLGPGQMCMGSGRGTDACKGDSGGPVMRTAPVSGNLVSTLVGIISYGFGTCGTTTSVSTYVPFYLDWIFGQLT